MTQSGNIVVTDKDLKILAINRVVSEGEGGEAQQIGLQYSLENRQNFHGIPPITTDRVKEALSKYTAPVTGAAGAPTGAKAKKSDLRKLLATSITEVPPILIEHSLDVHGIDIQTKPDAIAESPEQLDSLVKALADAASTAETIFTGSQCKGYIFARRRETKTAAEEADPEKGLLYDDFQPFVPKKIKDDSSITVVEFDNYNKTVDQFFSSLEGQKLESRLIERENAAANRLNTAKRDQAKRIEDLQEAQTLNMRKAAAIEANVERVQEAMDAVSSLVDQGMDWVDIGRLIEREKTKQNPVAQMVHLPLKLEENTITLLLNEADEEEEEEDDADSYSTDESDLEEEDTSTPKNDKPTKALKVDIVLSLSPWSNAREYYDQRRTAASKEEKTHIQNEKALKSAEQKIQTDLKKVLKTEKALLQPIRQPMWFEKFFWFVSSDGYLVLAGKDPAQHELLYKRHLGKGDVFCHADTKDACAVIIKNNPLAPDSPIPPTTLSQAGNFCICSSAAWDSKAGMGAWWANASQVSKLNAAGEVLPNGEFYVQGDKNHLPPGQLIMGLGLMFKISEASTANHLKNRPGIYTGYVPKTDPATEVPTDQATPDAQSETESVADLTDDEDAKNEPAVQDEPVIQEKDKEADAPAEAAESLKKLEIEETTAPEPEAAPVDEPEGDDDDKDSARDSRAPSSKGAPKRGQRRKAKKLAAKYKDQDEEDRLAAEALLGSALGAQRAEARAKEREDRTAWLEAERARKQAVKSRQDKQTKEFEKQRRANTQAEADGYVEQPLALLDGLVGTPSAGDEIVDVVVVCAPISATTKLKYKIKMQPGPQKKGKLVREVLERWKIDSARKGVVDEQATDSGRMWPREVELMKGLKAEEVVNVVPVAKARVMLSGGASGGKGSGSGSGGKGGGGGGGGRGKSKK